MKAIRRFTVRTVLPEALAPLGELALNLRWSWDTATQELFAGLDPTIPAAALAAIGSADEALVRTTLGGLVDAVAGIDPRLPLVVLVGSVTAEGVAQAIAQLSEAA